MISEMISKIQYTDFGRSRGKERKKGVERDWRNLPLVGESQEITQKLPVQIAATIVEFALVQPWTCLNHCFRLPPLLHLEHLVVAASYLAPSKKTCNAGETYIMVAG